MDENQNPIINSQAVNAASSSAAQPIEPDIKNLEEEFKKELGGGENASGLGPKMPELEETRKKFEQKINMLEDDVKNKLKELKDLRATIENELKEIKDLKKTGE